MKRVGYTSSYLPPEIIYACGLTPVRLQPGNSRSAPLRAGLAAADSYLPRNFSVEARALLAAALEGNLDLDAVIFLDEDDTSRRFFDVWAAYTDIAALGLVPLPRLDNDLARQRYAQALAGVARSLTAISSQPLTDERLRRAIDLYNKQRAWWRALRQRWIEGCLSAGCWHELRWLALTTDPETANAELAATSHNGETPDTSAADGPRLLILGAMHVPHQFLTFLDTYGAHIVAEDSEADERTLTEVILTHSQSPLESLAAAYLNKPPGPRPNAFSIRLTRLTQLLNERGVQGVIAYYPKFADAYLAEYLMLAEMFRERSLPALLLEDDGESGFSGQQLTRVEAFLEVLA